MSDGIGVDLATSGGPRILAASIALVGAMKFAKWLIEFVTARMDVGHKRLADRLEHVEMELAATREALMLMINHAAERHPGDKVLQQVARILSTIAPKPKRDLDEIVDRLNAMPGSTYGGE
jgi:hypothetical protein